MAMNWNGRCLERSLRNEGVHNARLERLLGESEMKAGVSLRQLHGLLVDAVPNRW